MQDPGRLVIGHPVNPPYLLPLVEVVPGDKTSKQQTEGAMTFYESVGKNAGVGDVQALETAPMTATSLVSRVPDSWS